MKTTLPALHNKFLKSALADKLLVIIFTILLVMFFTILYCLTNNLYAGISPNKIKRLNGHIKKSSNNIAKINATGVQALPTISYSTPQVYTAGATITPLSPTSSGVAAIAYDNTMVNISSGLTGPRGLAVDAVGNIYVADYLGGAVKKLPIGGGAPVTLGSGFSHPMGVAVDAAGNVYVADLSNTNIMMIPFNGGVPVIVATGFINPFGIAIDAAGNLYVADNGNKAIKKIPADGGPVVILGSGFNALACVAVDAAGNVYAGDSGDHAVYELPVGGGPRIVIGSGPASPLGLAIDGEGNIYVADSFNDMVKKIPAGGGAPVMIGSGNDTMTGVAIDGSGNLYVSQFGFKTVNKISLTGGYHINAALPAGLVFNAVTGTISGTPVAGSPATTYVVTAFNSTGSSQANVNITVNALNISYSGPQSYITATPIAPLAPTSSGVAVAGYSNSPVNVGSGFSKPRCLVMDALGNIFVGDYGSNSIKKIPAGGGVPVTIGFVNSPTAIALDAAGNVYVADFGSSAIRKIPVGGGAIVSVGSGFLHPNGLAIDGAGNIFVADNGNHAMKEIPADGSAIINLGTYTYLTGVATDAAGNIYFAEKTNGVIYKLPSTGGIPFIITSGFTNPLGITVDASGNLFIADGSTTTILELPALGNTVVPISSGFGFPASVITDKAGNLYVADYLNNVVKIVKPTGGYYINALPAGLVFDNATGIISGTPAVVSVATNYTVTAYNTAGSNAATISIKVDPLPLPTVSYISSLKPYAVNNVITPLPPVSTGVAAPGYSNSPVTARSGLDNPVGIAADAIGSIYIAEAGSNLVRKASPGNINTFVAGSGFNYPSAVAVDAASNIYVADQLNNVIKRIPYLGGSPVVIGSGFNNPCGVAVDVLGNVYVVDKGNNAIKKIPAGGGVIVTVGSGFSQPSGVAVDAAGNIYVADTGNDAIKMIAVGGGAPVILGSGFSQPAGVAIDASGNIYVADTGNNLIEKMPAGGGAPETISTAFIHPLSLAVDGAGIVYITDNLNGKIKSIKPVGGYFVSPSLPGGLSIDNTTGIISGTPLVARQAQYYYVSAYNYTGSDTHSALIQVDLFPPPTISYATPKSYTVNKTITALTPVSTNVSAVGYNSSTVTLGSGFTLPIGVAIDRTGNIYVADKGNGLLKKIAAVGGAITNIGTGFSDPAGVAVDGAGNVYVSDNVKNKIFKIPANGGATAIIGTGFINPNGVAVDTLGNVYVADNGGNVIKKIPFDGSPIVIVASGFASPSGVAIDVLGNIYVADSGNNAIKMLPAGGGLPMVIGSGFNQPTGIAVDASGNVYVSDFNNNAIKLIPKDGSAIISIGSGFNRPFAVAVDGTGNVYVSDYLNSAVKKIAPLGGYFISPSLPPGLTLGNNTGIISGKPLVASPATDYKITVYNASASSFATANITVNLLPPPSVSYVNPPAYLTGKAIKPLTPAGSGVAQPAFSSTPFTLSSGGIPIWVAVDAAGNLYVADNANNTVKEIPINGGPPVIMGSGFTHPNGIAVDAAGNIYVSNLNSSVVQMIPAGGGAQVSVGSGFLNPYGLATDAAGGLFVSDYNDGFAYKIPPGGGNPIKISSYVSSPTGIAVAASGNIYIASYSLSSIKKFPSDGSPAVVVGQGFNNLYGIALDNAENVFVADYSSTIKEIPAGGGVPIIIGNGFVHPTGIAVDAVGSIYVGDVGSQKLSKINRAGGYYINPALPAGLKFNDTTGVISGTPIATIKSTNFTITAYNGSGGTSTNVNITINAPIPPPSITYTTPNNFSPGVAVSLSPVNSGGAVPATIYSQVATFSGSGASGSANGAGAVATFVNPWCMAADASGNIYVADFTANLIRKVTPAGAVSTLAGSGAVGSADGTGVAASFKNPSGIAIDGAGNLYVTDGGNNMIRMITPAGVVTTFAGSTLSGSIDGTGAAAKFKSPRGIAINGAGDFYVADYGNNQIRKITAAGVVTTLAGSGAPGSLNGTGLAATFNSPIALATDAAGNIYVADYAGNQVREVTPAGVVTTLAGSGVAGSANGTGAAATFKNPFGITVDNAGNVYVADRGNSLIRKITAAGVVSTLAGSGVTGSANGTGIAAQLNDPRGITTDASGNLYVADYGGHQIRKILLSGYAINTILPGGLSFNSTTGIISGTAGAVSPPINYQVTAYNGSGSSTANVNIKISLPLIPAPNITYTTSNNYTSGVALNLSPVNSGGAVPATIYSQVATLAGSGASGSANGAGTVATFVNPLGMATDASGNIYVADFTANLIRKITPAGAVSTLAGSGAVGSANGTGAAASFKNPSGIAIDGAGNVYVADGGNNMIRMITPAGVVTTFAGSTSSGTTNGTGAAAKFQVPRGIAIDGVGDFYVADYGNNQIRKITAAGVVTTLAGSGALGSLNGTGLAATFNSPFALATDAGGNVYVADYAGNQVRKITPAGVVTTLAGSGAAGSVNGTGAAAMFKSPFGIAVDNAGNIYVADRGNSLLRKVTAAGVVTTFAGSGVSGSANGIGAAAQFNDPRGITTDLSGNIYVADFGGHQVRKIALTGYTITTSLPAGLTFNGTTGAISGIPTAATPATNYIVIAYNTGGSSTANVNIKVNAPLPPPNITYTTPNTFAAGTAASLSPVNSGGAIPATIYSQVATLAGSGASGSADGAGAAATFVNPWGMAADASGNIYVADFTANLIRKVTPAGAVSTLAGSGAVGSADGTGVAASFKNPSGIAIDGAGNLYVTDGGNNMIRMITPAGVVTTFAGSTLSGSIDGTGAAAKFKSPRGIAINGAGDFYVADYGNNQIRKITAAGVVTTLAGSGAPGSLNGTGLAATFNSPIALATDAAGNIYVADYAGNQVREVTPAGVVTALAGSGVAGAANGTGTAATFKNPFGITVDNAGNVYVADRGNSLIRKITAAGVVTTLAGSGVSGSVNGTGIAAQLNDPRGITTDALGNMYVADYGGHQIRKIALTGYTINAALPVGLAFDGTTGIISGTPTAASPAINYTVTGYNKVGSSVATLSITIASSAKMQSLALVATDVTPADSALNAPHVKQGFSPNGDGNNDVLIINNIERYPKNKLIIVNNSGVEIYQAAGYDNVSKVFDGHSSKSSVMQRPGTYFYRLEYDDNGKLKYKTGFVLIKY
jgi:gliding motility-associated-like protein